LSKSYFDQAAADYRTRSSSWPWSFLRELEWGAVKKCLPALASTTKIIDLGCGSGFYLHKLRELGSLELIGVDQSEAMLKEVKSAGFQTICSNMEEPIHIQGADLVLCAGALEFSKHPEQVFSRVSGMLKDSGSFVLLYPDKSFAGNLYRMFHRRHGLMVNIFSDADIQKLGHSAGFQIIKSVSGGPLARVVLFRKNTP
jgi:predicted TPR repeat methyltransferase